MILFHRTEDGAAALAILQGREWISRENDSSVYFSNRADDDAQAVGYGPIVVSVDVPDELAVLDDEFPDGELHFRVKAEHLAGLPVTVAIGHHRVYAYRNLHNGGE